MDYKEKVIALLNGKELSQEQKEKLEEIFPELKESEDEKISKELITYCRNTICRTEEGAKRILKWIAWLEKQGQKSKKVSIWKHWKDGICGNGEGKQTYLIKMGNTYSLSSGLGFECDYIELSALDDLILKKQDEHLENYDEAEKEKADFVGDGFIECHADFLDFKEGNTYWLEYVGDDKYNVRSDNLLNKTYHITPCQLYTVFKKLTWFEKQGKQPTSKIEPKFKVADWIVDNCGYFWKIKEILNQFYCLKDIEGRETFATIEWVDNAFHIWTIADAKDGDVLTNGESIVIFKKIIEPEYRQHIEAYVGLDLCRNIQVTSESWSLGIDKAMPATKKQHDLLFHKMKEDGWEWDAEKKKLKKIQ